MPNTAKELNRYLLQNITAQLFCEHRISRKTFRGAKSVKSWAVLLLVGIAMMHIRFNIYNGDVMKYRIYKEVIFFTSPVIVRLV